MSKVRFEAGGWCDCIRLGIGKLKESSFGIFKEILLLFLFPLPMPLPLHGVTNALQVNSNA